ncbi:hypothetical protein BGZ63DRAFT_399415 [Mariannaea sp. PMI_226]|nr:hypothetical protein BGZ63DRAFT_399415 [Mariannaea sp. PMI_226]
MSFSTKHETARPRRRASRSRRKQEFRRARKDRIIKPSRNSGHKVAPRVWEWLLDSNQAWDHLRLGVAHPATTHDEKPDQVRKEEAQIANLRRIPEQTPPKEQHPQSNPEGTLPKRGQGEPPTSVGLYTGCLLAIMPDTSTPPRHLQPYPVTLDH